MIYNKCTCIYNKVVISTKFRTAGDVHNTISVQFKSEMPQKQTFAL